MNKIIFSAVIVILGSTFAEASERSEVTLKCRATKIIDPIFDLDDFNTKENSEVKIVDVGSGYGAYTRLDIGTMSYSNKDYLDYVEFRETIGPNQISILAKSDHQDDLSFGIEGTAFNHGESPGDAFLYIYKADSPRRSELVANLKCTMAPRTKPSIHRF